MAGQEQRGGERVAGGGRRAGGWWQQGREQEQQGQGRAVVRGMAAAARREQRGGERVQGAGSAGAGYSSSAENGSGVGSGWQAVAEGRALGMMAVAAVAAQHAVAMAQAPGSGQRPMAGTGAIGQGAAGCQMAYAGMDGALGAPGGVDGMRQGVLGGVSSG
jgi:hypothetical protein